jgi:hypothetical protein
MEIPLRSLLLDSSNGVIGEFELSRLNLAANLKKEMRGTIEHIIDSLVEARVARWFLENKAELRNTASPFYVGQESFDFGGDTSGEWKAKLSASDRFRADSN